MEQKHTTNPKPSAVGLLQPITVSVKDAAAALSLSRSGIYKLMTDGKLPFVTIGSRRLLKVSDIQAFIDGGAA